MFFKTNYMSCLLFGFLLPHFVVVGCTAPEPSHSEQIPSAAVSKDSSEVETENSGTAGDGNGTTESENVVDSSAVEPLNLERDVDVQTVASILDREDVFLLDVREVNEHEAGHIAGNTLIPTGTVAERLAEIPKDKEVIVYCHSGARSNRVTQYLTQQGYTNVHNMLGGIVAWQNAGLAVEQ